MKKGKRLLALVIAVSLVAGLAPMSSTSYAEETGEEATLNETLLLSDDFSSASWNTSTASPEGCWTETTSTEYNSNRAGSIVTINGDYKAPLGNLNSNRNLYRGVNTSVNSLTNVHIKSTVCVTGEYVSGTNSQYHLLLARGTGEGKNGVAFGFKTADGATATSLIVGLYKENDTFTSVYTTTEAKYSLNEEYELELYVIGDSLVIAKCDGETIFADVASDIPANGRCGIIDRRASSKTSTATYGEGGYQKGGYFDNFSISTITLDGFRVNGPVIVDQTGVGVADITITSGGVDIAELQDVSVTVPDLAGKGCSLYEGNYNVTTTLSGETRTATANRVFVVESIENAVTCMNDERWTGATAADGPNFTVDETGKATLTNKKYSVLSMGENDGVYNEFYAEYTLKLSDIAAGMRNWYSTCFNTVTRDNYSAGGFTADVLHDLRDNKEAFYARLQNRTASNTVGTYANGTIEGDVAVGDSMRIGLLVYNNVVTYTLNGNTVGTYTYPEGTEASKGWFALYNDIDTNSSAKATVEDFIYVPLSEKAVVDLEVSDIADVQRYGAISPSVTLKYNWPNADVEAAQEDVTIEGFDNTRVGEQTVTVKYTENNVTVTKEVTVNVVDNSVRTIIYENFEENGLTNTEEWSNLTNVDTVKDGKLVMSSAASARTVGTVEAGYLETTIAITDTTMETLGKAVDFRYRVNGSNYIILRLSVAKDSEGNVSRKLQEFVYINQEQKSSANVSLDNVAIGEEWTIRFTVIGNYLEVMLDGNVIANLQWSLGNTNDLITGEGAFWIETTDDVTVEMDKLSIVEYTPYMITKDDTINLDTYKDISDSSQSWSRSAFFTGEQVVVATDATKELSVGGLRYTIDGVSTSYSVTERRYGAGQERDVCNQFVFNMPSGNITLTADYYGDGEEETNANIGIKGVDIRKKTEDKKLGLRFSSRSYQTYVKDDVTYTLDEVGTLLFNEKVTSITDDIKDACRTSEGGIYKDGDTTIGKCITATKAQDICNDFIDWGLILTYEADSEFIDTEYTACSYAKYVDDNGTEIYVYGDTTTYSIATVAESIGYEIQ